MNNVPMIPMKIGVAHNSFLDRILNHKALTEGMPLNTLTNFMVVNPRPFNTSNFVLMHLMARRNEPKVKELLDSMIVSINDWD